MMPARVSSCPRHVQQCCTYVVMTFHVGGNVLAFARSATSPDLSIPRAWAQTLVCYAMQRSGGMVWTHVPPPLSSFATQVERALGIAWRSAHPCANTPRDSCSLHRSSYVAASVLIMRSRVGLINCFIAANAPRNRYEKQSWLFQRPHGQQR